MNKKPEANVRADSIPRRLRHDACTSQPPPLDRRIRWPHASPRSQRTIFALRQESGVIQFLILIIQFSPIKYPHGVKVIMEADKNQSVQGIQNKVTFLLSKLVTADISVAGRLNNEYMVREQNWLIPQQAKVKLPDGKIVVFKFELVGAGDLESPKKVVALVAGDPRSIKHELNVEGAFEAVRVNSDWQCSAQKNAEIKLALWALAENEIAEQAKRPLKVEVSSEVMRFTAPVTQKRGDLEVTETYSWQTPRIVTLRFPKGRSIVFRFGWVMLEKDGAKDPKIIVTTEHAAGKQFALRTNAPFRLKRALTDPEGWVPGQSLDPETLERLLNISRGISSEILEEIKNLDTEKRDVEHLLKLLSNVRSPIVQTVEAGGKQVKAVELIEAEYVAAQMKNEVVPVLKDLSLDGLKKVYALGLPEWKRLLGWGIPAHAFMDSGRLIPNPSSAPVQQCLEILGKDVQMIINDTFEKNADGD
ncbi:MAG: hypothetical protein MUC65_01920 [Pontiellaceae bacterium]|nr:hypothetical protein [Pontiellaceae bacterium]